MLNGIALLLVGGYTGAVVLHGNLDALLNALGEDREFLKWAAALGIIMAIGNSSVMGPLGKTIATLTIAGLAFKVTRDVEFQNVLNLLKSGGK